MMWWRALFILIVYVLSPVTSWADVTATVIGTEINRQGVITVKVSYAIDGVEVQTNDPPLNGHFYLTTSYTVISFLGMTQAQIRATIRDDIQHRAEVLLQQEYLRKVNTALNESDTLAKYIGASLTVSTATINVDGDGNGIADTQWTVKTDGTRTEAPYTPPPTIP